MQGCRLQQARLLSKQLARELNAVAFTQISLGLTPQQSHCGSFLYDDYY